MLEFKALGPEQKDQLKSHRGKAMKGDNWGCEWKRETECTGVETGWKWG